MTDEMEKDVFEGNWPLKMTGFYIIRPGEAVPNVLLGRRRGSARTGYLEKKSDVFHRAQSSVLKRLSKWLKSSREKKQTKLESLRERLDDAWDRMRKHGLEAKNQYREWLARRLDSPRNERDGAKSNPHLSRVAHIARWSEVNSRFRRQSERIEDLYESVDQFNAVSGRYCEIRRIAKEVGKKEGYSSSSILINETKGDGKTRMKSSEEEEIEGQSPEDKYIPKQGSKPERIVNAIVNLIKKWGDLNAYNKMTDLWEEVYHIVEDDGDKEGKGAAHNTRECMRTDLKRKGFEEKFPDTVEEAEQLVREVSPRLERQD